MTCTELELLLCDYIDGTLRPEERAEAEAHLAGCAACTELHRDSSGVLGFLERIPAVEPPPSLVTRILHQAPAKQPPVNSARSTFGKLLGRWLEPVLQPRLVMGMAMTILSFAMLGRFAGIEARQLRPADLHPAKVWEATEDQVNRAWTRAVKYYESLKIVYVLQSRLREITDTDDDGLTPADRRQERKQEQKPKTAAPAAESPGAPK
ncbi:MAG: zf-HC2 domain-containing protein [Bryobacterales bacterium]|nr:zf-HC2 domain-containing protein [Bryobacterales bacterium]